MNLWRLTTGTTLGRAFSRTPAQAAALWGATRSASKVTPTDAPLEPSDPALPPMYAPNYDFKYAGEHDIPEEEDINPDMWGPDYDRSVNPYYAAGALGVAFFSLWVVYQAADLTSQFVHISPAAARELDTDALQHAYTHYTATNPCKSAQ